MKEIICSYETARLAKEKGFDIEQQQHYTRIDEGEWKLHENNPFNHLSFYEKAEIVEAPTQSLLDKWLRDVHKTFVAIYPIQSWWEVDVRDCDMSKRVHSSPIKPNLALKGFRFKTYEQALEAGLQEALKRIKKSDKA